MTTVVDETKPKKSRKKDKPETQTLADVADTVAAESGATAETIATPPDGVTDAPVDDPKPEGWAEAAAASAKAAQPENEEFADTMPLPISPSEQKALTNQLLSALDEVDEIKMRAAEIAGERKEAVTKVNELRRALSKGERPTDVITKLVFETNTAESRRKDTGELVHTRSITYDERQKALSFDTKPKPAPTRTGDLFDSKSKPEGEQLATVDEAVADAAGDMAGDDVPDFDDAPSSTDIDDPDALLEAAEDDETDEDEGL